MDWAILLLILNSLPRDPDVIKFKEFNLDCDRFELRRSGRVVKLERKPMELLILLVEKKGHLVTRDEIVKCLWGSEVFIDSEHGINTAIRKIRRALRDDREKHCYVETVSGKGYRFIAALTAEGTETNGAASNGAASYGAASQVVLSLNETKENGKSEWVPGPFNEPPFQNSVDESVVARRKNPGQVRLRYWVTAVVVGLLAVGLGVQARYFNKPAGFLRVVEYTPITYDGKTKNLAGADSSRIYFNPNFYDPNRVAQVSISGGGIAPVPVALANPWIMDVSPDGSNLLVRSEDGVQSLWSVRVPGGSTRRLLTSVYVTSAAWSPDGKSVVYNTVDDKNVSKIFIVKSDGTGALEVASGGKAERLTNWDVSWSPDGKTIRFTNNGELWTVSSDGSNLQRLLPAWSSPDICCGRWTPDGKFFVFLSEGSNKSAFDSMAWRGAQIWALDERRGLFRRSSSEPVQLTSGPIRWSAAIPSKDGTKIFAQGRVLRGELVHLDVKSKQLKPWLGGISAEHLTFSPDGKFIAYVTYPEGILWRANRDGSSPEQLTSRPMYPLNPRWSPDGTQIVFCDFASANRFQIFVIPSGGGAPRPLLPEDKSPQIDPNWSPDGKRIVFASEETNEGTPTAVIKVLELATHRVTTLPGSKGMWSPRWSPNGRFVAGFSNQDSLTVFDFETQRWSPLFIGDAPPRDYLTWSRDGKFLYFVHRGAGAGVFRVRPSGGAAERVIDLAGFRFTGSITVWMGLDPEDTPMLIRDVGTTDIYALTLEQN